MSLFTSKRPSQTMIAFAEFFIGSAPLPLPQATGPGCKVERQVTSAGKAAADGGDFADVQVMVPA